MPYIVTIHPTIDGAGQTTTRLEEELTTRRAVATLDEALDRSLVAREKWATLESDGGTIGPLPDGTVIEVERVRWSDINPDMDADPQGPEDAEIELAAYNAAQDARECAADCGAELDHDRPYAYCAECRMLGYDPDAEPAELDLSRCAAVGRDPGPHAGALLARANPAA